MSTVDRVKRKPVGRWFCMAASELLQLGNRAVRRRAALMSALSGALPLPAGAGAVTTSLTAPGEHAFTVRAGKASSTQTLRFTVTP